jgi:hypothetical protein
MAIMKQGIFAHQIIGIEELSDFQRMLEDGVKHWRMTVEPADTAQRQRHVIEIDL